jgi:hypothetical protein
MVEAVMTEALMTATVLAFRRRDRDIEAYYASHPWAPRVSDDDRAALARLRDAVLHEDLDAMLAAARATKTRERSPLLLSEFFLKPLVGDAAVVLPFTSPEDFSWCDTAQACGKMIIIPLHAFLALVPDDYAHIASLYS